MAVDCSSGLWASKDRFVGPTVEKNLKSLNEQNYAEFNSDEKTKVAQLNE